MANTTLVGANTIQVTGLDADWLLATALPKLAGGIKLKKILFDPSGAGDVAVVNDVGVDGAVLAYMSCIGTDDQKVLYFDGVWCSPVIDISDWTLATAANARIIFEFE